MHFRNTFLSYLHIINVLSLTSARITQYIICGDNQELYINAAVAEARSLARSADVALRDLDVVYSESYAQWFGFANRDKKPTIMGNNDASLYILSGRMSRISVPITLTDINSGSILYISVNATSGSCVDKKILSFTNSEALPTPYSMFSSILFLCPSFFELPITTSLLDQNGAGKAILREARHMIYMAGLLHSSNYEDSNLSILHSHESLTSCHSAQCCSKLDNSQKYKNTENSIKFALDAKYRRELTKGNPCFVLEPAYRLQIQPRAASISSYASSLWSSVFNEVQMLQPRSVYDCEYVSVSESVSYSVSWSYSKTISPSYLQSLTCSTMTTTDEEKTMIQETSYMIDISTAYYTYPGYTVPYTYLGTTVAYTKTSTETINMKRTDVPLSSLLPSTTIASSPTMSSSSTFHDVKRDANHENINNPTPRLEKPTSLQPISINQAPTSSIRTKACNAMTPLPTRSFVQVNEFKENVLVNGSQLGQVLQLIKLA